MKVLALDHGSARTGVAISDPTGTIVRPLSPIAKVGSTAGFERLLGVIGAEQPAMILVGEPRHLSGDVGAQARDAQRFADRLRSRVAVPVQLVDERLTTVEAGRRAAESGSRTSVDSLAACVLLESYLGAGAR